MSQEDVMMYFVQHRNKPSTVKEIVQKTNMSLSSVQNSLRRMLVYGEVERDYKKIQLNGKCWTVFVWKLRDSYYRKVRRLYR